MNEVQGPTPAGTSRPYRSLAEALRAHRIPVENHEFIGAVTDAVGILSYIDRGRYIEALRRDGAALHIGRTYINGFTEDEQITVAGRVLPLLPSEGRAPYFYVNQPSGLPRSPSRPSDLPETAPPHRAPRSWHPLPARPRRPRWRSATTACAAPASWCATPQASAAATSDALRLLTGSGRAQESSACTRREISAIGIDRGNTATTTSSGAASDPPGSTP